MHFSQSDLRTAECSALQPKLANRFTMAGVSAVLWMSAAILFAATGYGVPDDAEAHGGGLDRNGCHHDNSNGGYHCHR
jgi:hypothetical protein